jgi:hypothetical protein
MYIIVPQRHRCETQRNYYRKEPGAPYAIYYRGILTMYPTQGAESALESHAAGGMLKHPWLLHRIYTYQRLLKLYVPHVRAGLLP